MGLFSGKPETPAGDGVDATAVVAPPVPKSMPSMLKQTAGIALGTERNSQFDQLKVRIHQQLVQRLDVQNLKSLPPDTVRAEVRIVIRDLCQNERGLLTSQDQERLMDEVMDETFGLGPLETLLKTRRSRIF